jgi:hypothetical protein
VDRHEQGVHGHLPRGGSQRDECSGWTDRRLRWPHARRGRHRHQLLGAGDPGSRERGRRRRERLHVHDDVPVPRGAEPVRAASRPSPSFRSYEGEVPLYEASR